MSIHNIEIAKIFNTLADLLEVQGDNPFRVRAYRQAAWTISGMPKNITDLIKENADLTELPHIGKDLAEKIKIIVATGSLPQLEETQKKVPAVVSDLMKIPGLGPKRVQKLHTALNIHTLAELKLAITTGKLRNLPGFGEKTAAMILSGIQHRLKYSRLNKLADLVNVGQSLISYLKKCKAVLKADIAGSYRRCKESVRDLDIVVAAKQAITVINHFVSFEEISEIISKGTTRSSVRLHSGIQVDLRVVAPKSYGAALLYLTGSKAHNIALRKIALTKKLKINEYGVFKKNHFIAGNSEAAIYKAINLPYIAPELREDRGEIAYAQKQKLPKLITLQDIRGDLHCHTNATDGNATLEQMVLAAIELGYEYLAITDHTKHLSMVHGLDEKKLLQQIKLIDRLNAKFAKFTILKASEVDILENGSLDLSNDMLKELDLTVCSIHSKFNLPAKKQTERIIRAMDNPYFNILGHPTGRLINKREPYDIDLLRIMKAAKERGCILEINAQPSRLDLNDINCQTAKSMKLKLAISTDAHSIPNLDFMQFGVNQARRGWVEAKEVINTYSLTRLRKALSRN